MQTFTIVPPSNQHSYSVSTTRNYFFYWLSNFTLFPLYILLLSILLKEIPEIVSRTPAQSELIRAILFPFYLGALIPLVSSFLTISQRYMGLRYRELLTISSALIMIVFITDQNNNGNHIAFLGTLMILWLILGSILALNNWRLRLRASIVVGLFATLVVSIRIYGAPAPAGSEFQYASVIIQLIVLLAIVTNIVLPFRRLFIHAESQAREGKVKILQALSVVLGLIILLLTFTHTPQQSDEAIVSLLILLASAHPEKWMSRQKANLRILFRSLRHDVLSDQSSPLVGLVNRFNRLIYLHIPQIFRFENRRLFIYIALVFGGIGIPLIYIFYSGLQANGNNRTLPSFPELMLLGITSSIILMAMYIVLWLIRSQSRFIINQFEAVTHTGDDGKVIKDKELTAISNLMAQILVEEMQRISKLLRARQVENVNLSPDDSNVFFVTSGIDNDFMSDIGDAININDSNLGTIPLGHLLKIMSEVIAHIRIDGKVYRRENGNIEIWAQLFYGRRKSVFVQQQLLDKAFTSQIDGVVVRPIARNLAIRLYMELGYINHLGSTVESLDNFLIGLEASIERNWWRAISRYRRALQIEETNLRVFGIGHYHLGVALIYQGYWPEGLNHLYTAEVDGPLIPETQYMIALAILYIHWTDLDKKPNKFKQIERRLKIAIKQRQDFAEAHHLLGSAYYRRARILEHRATNNYEKREDITEQYTKYSYNYRQAESQFRRALSLYDTRLIYFPAFNDPGQAHYPNKSELMRQRMIVAHQLGDALRSLEHFSEAEGYYDDMMEVFPRNLRNLADLSKTYCLAGNWQRAEEFLWKDVEVYEHNLATWDTDISIHMGWALSGGIYDSNSDAAKKILDSVINSIYPKNNIQLRRPLGEQLTVAMQFIDYSIYTRPLYAAYWWQTDWFKPFNDAYEKIEKETVSNFQFTEIVDNNDHYKPEQVIAWLALRIDSFNIPSVSDDPIENFKPWIAISDEIIESLRLHQHYSDLPKHYQSLKDLRYKVAQHVARQQDSNRSEGLILNFVRLELAREAYELWEEASATIKELKGHWEPQYSSKTRATFIDRWAVDVYSEISILSARLFAEADVPEYTYMIATEGCEIITFWMTWWQNTYMRNQAGIEDHFSFSPRVSRYQHATLQAWKAFGKFYSCYHPLAKSRLQTKFTAHDNKGRLSVIRNELKNLPVAYNKTIHRALNKALRHVSPEPARTTAYDDRGRLDSLRNDLNDPPAAYNATIQTMLNQARRYISHHPLVMFMEAQLDRQAELYPQAVEKYERLIDLIAPYDPKRKMGSNDLDDDSKVGIAESSIRGYMHNLERACGRLQFSTFINQARLHLEIAETYREMNKPELRVKHLTEAQRWSKFDDLDIQIFLRLASQLNDMERYSEALAVIDAIRTPKQHIGQAFLSQTLYQLSDILEAVINTRAKHFVVSLDQIQLIARNFEIYITSLRQVDYALNSSILFSKLFAEGEKNEVIAKFKNIYECAFTLLIGPVDKNTDSRAYYLDVDNNQGFTFKPNNKNLAKRPEIKDKSIKDYVYTNLKQILDSDILEDKSSTKVFQIFDKLLLLLLKDQTALDLLNNLMNQAAPSIAEQELNLAIEQLHIAWQSQSPDAKYDILGKIFASQVLMFLSREASNKLVQIAEICNNMAFNRAETNTRLEIGVVDATCATYIMDYLLTLSDRNTATRSAFRIQQAQFYDTLGWVIHKAIIAKDEREAFENSSGNRAEENPQKPLPKEFEPTKLLEMGLRYEQDRSIIHYHLAKVYQYHYQQATKNGNVGLQGYLLEKAKYHWRVSKKDDKFDRLHFDLADLHEELFAPKPEPL